jgi:2-oxoglutarate ferredoxin oxidoreductase subunit alpha
MSTTHFWQGNEACGEAAIAAGCRFFAGYPITPASEIFEHLARRLPQVGGISIQMEDEIASLGAVIGASWTGAKAMTATSGPGFSLMQELMGYAFMTETPCVVVDVQRAGPSTGQATKCGQGDVMQARWGTHGDYSSIALSPNSVQEMFDLTIRAFNLAENYRTPVVLLADEIVAHMREQVVIPPANQIETVNRKKPTPTDKAFFNGQNIAPMPSVGEGYNVPVTGSTHNEQGYRFTADRAVHEKLVKNLIGKIRNNAEKIVDYESVNVDKCDVGVVSFGVRNHRTSKEKRVSRRICPVENGLAFSRRTGAEYGREREGCCCARTEHARSGLRGRKNRPWRCPSRPNEQDWRRRNDHTRSVASGNHTEREEG